MGRAKEMMLEAEVNGFDIDANIIVCTKCFGNDAIKQFISNDTGSDCTYCSKKGDASCSLKLVLEHVMTCIRTEWGRPANEGLVYETREGGWQGEVYNTWNLFDIVGIEINGAELLNDIESSLMDDDWCRQNPYSLAKDRILFYGWINFSRFVMTEARYVFLNATPSTYNQYQHDEIHPVKILEALTDITKELDLIELWDKEKAIFRVRVVNSDVSFHSAKELGSPSLEFASIPNRMSPSGIPMFYGAFDKQTAVSETYDPEISTDKKAICGVFYPIRDLVLLNLSKPLSIPDLFDEKSNANCLTIKVTRE